MFKTLKKSLSILLALTLVLTSISSVVLADAITDAASGSAITPNVVTNVTLTSQSNGVGGKSSNDAYYSLVSSTGTTSSYLQMYAGNQTMAAFTYELSFLLPEGSSGITLTPRYRVYRSGLDWQPTDMTITTSGFNPGGSYKAIVPGTEFEYDKWYNLALVFPYAVGNSEATEGYDYYKTMKVYVNGELKGAFDYTAQTMTYAEILYYNKIFISPNDTNPVYIDNIRRYQGACNSENDDAKPRLTTASTAVSISDNTIKYIGDVTVAQLKAAITKASDTNLRVYNISGNLADDSVFVTDGMKLVAAASNGTGMERTYSYYTIRENVYDYGSTLYEGSKALGYGGSGTLTYNRNVPGFGGKAANDVVYCIPNGTTSTPYVSPVAPSGPVGRETLEFSMYIPKGSKGAYLEVGASTLPALVSGEYNARNYVFSENAYFPADEWHNVSLVFPGPVEFDSAGNPTAYDRYYELYIDGVKKNEVNGNFTTSSGQLKEAVGVRHIRLYGNNKSGSQTSFYIDNIRRTTDAYNTSRDVIPAITASNTTHRFEDGKFVLESSPTVAQFIAGISADKVDFRVIDANGQVMADDAKISNDTCKLVVASKNGTNVERAYKYYNIIHDKFSYELNVLRDGVPAANFYDNNAALTFGATFNNYDGNTYNPTLYVAFYKDSTLEKVWTDSATLTEVGTTAELSVNVADMPAQREGTSIKVMLVEAGSLNPYATAKTLRYGYADTPTTLYIIGDSIAQTYEINAPGGTASGKSPFIQGWGYHIASYLNDNVTVDNRARSGWDTDRFLYPDGIYTKEDGVDSAGDALLDKDGNQKIVPASERYKCWPSIKNSIKAGDYFIIALGINDNGSANVPFDRYEENITVMTREAQALGAKVILSTPTINGGKWEETWSFKEDYKDRANSVEKVAAATGAICLPTGATLATLYNKLYNDYAAANPDATTLQKRQYVRAQFHRYDAVFNTPVEEGGYGYTNFSGLNDHQHYADKGAYKVAGIIADLIVKSGSTLGDYVVVPQ